MSKNPILHATIKGEGELLLILHGYFGMGDNWKSLGNQFAKKYQVHLIDQRNHGRSFHADEFSYELLVDDLHNYILHHQLEKVNLIGHSMGGKTAMLFAVTYPELLNKLVIVDISPRNYKPHHNAILAGLNSIDFSLQNSRNLVDEKLSKYIPDFGVRQFLMKSLYRPGKDQFDWRFNLNAIKLNIENVGQATDEMDYEGDTLFLRGGNSNYITDEDWPDIKMLFPNSYLITIDDAGHWLHAEKPVEFVQAVKEFLSL